MAKRHAEIVGAGIAGLTAAAALTQRGWTVRVHERAPSLRFEGFGIVLWENGARVLKAVGAFDEVTLGANRVSTALDRRGDGSVMARRPMGGSYRLTRASLIQALADAAVKRGAEIVCGSTAVGVTPEGELTMEDGRRLKADLVIVADGVNSRLRESLDLVKRRRLVQEGAFRLLIPAKRGEFSDEDTRAVSMWWSGSRRVISGLCSPDEMFIAFTCRANDDAGRKIPIDIESWSHAFPGLREYIERCRQTSDWAAVRWAQFQDIRLKRWSAGRVAVVGDAAHAVLPNLGQGGGLALMNAQGLAVALDERSDIGEALALWEARERPLTEQTQNWSYYYSWLTGVPSPVRLAALLAIVTIPPLRKSYFRAAHHWPTGTAPDDGAVQDVACLR